MDCFPNSVINHNGEFIAHIKSNTYFILKDCNSKEDIKCKILEWLSRPAYKAEPYSTKRNNDKFHSFILAGVNDYLDTVFSEKDMDKIYTYLGNACNHKKTLKFIESGYDMSILKDD
jgi:hypothetical protein|nr:MAG TPA: hypothetical protein [Caudoviricetes sp.]